MYIDYAELQASRRRPMYMRDWRAKLDAFLKFNSEILHNAGRYRMKSQQRLRKKNMKVSESIRINTLNPTLTSWSRRACETQKSREERLRDR